MSSERPNAAPEPVTEPVAAVARLFPEVGTRWPDLPEAEVIGRLMEDGDRADLRHALSRYGADAFARWLETRGGRQLSRRSRAFWETVLGTAASPSADAQDDLWLL